MLPFPTGETKSDYFRVKLYYVPYISHATVLMFDVFCARVPLVHVSRFCFALRDAFLNQADMNKLIARKFKQRPATQAETRDCAAAVGREQLAKASASRAFRRACR